MLIEDLQIQSGLSRQQLLYLSNTASKRYKSYTVQKRNGGSRTIHHPSRALKAIQRWLNLVLISKLPVHSSALAYRKGQSIRSNAAAHAKTRFTLRMDFKDFFPSFCIEHVREFIERKESEIGWGLSDDDLDFVANISTRFGFLTIGAPSSPTLTNAMMYGFDHRVSDWSDAEGLIYTRYADDLFISSQGPNELTTARDRILEESEQFKYAKLVVNNKKTTYLSRRYRRAVTGLIVTPAGRVSIGRERKREIKSMVYRFMMGSMTIEEMNRLRGLVGFSMGVEPSFFDSLCVKYGKPVLEKVIKGDWEARRV